MNHQATETVSHYWVWHLVSSSEQLINCRRGPRRAIFEPSVLLNPQLSRPVGQRPAQTFPRRDSRPGSGL